MDDLISRQAAISAIKEWGLLDGLSEGQAIEILADEEKVPSAQPEWNNHTVACLLAELFDDTCACNYNGIDEWLPIKCELLESCPNPVGVACWEQYLKHRAERRTDEGFD
jgi:hypothetical protein